MSSSESIQCIARAVQPTEMAVTLPLTQRPPTRRTHGPPHLCPMPSLFSRCVQERLGKSIEESRVLAPELIVECRAHFPWRSLMDSRARSKLSSRFFNQRILSFSGSVSTWTRWSDLVDVLSNRVVEIQGRVSTSYFLCQIIYWGEYRIISLYRRPRGQHVLHQKVLGCYFVLETSKQYLPVLSSMQVTLSCPFFLAPWYEAWIVAAHLHYMTISAKTHCDHYFDRDLTDVSKGNSGYP